VLKSEAEIWRGIGGGWRQLYGDYSLSGLSFEWHELQLGEDLDWGRTFHGGSLEVCLNFSGRGEFRVGERREEIGPEQIAVYAVGSGLEATRSSTTLHRFLTLEVSSEFLRKWFSGEWGGLLLEVRAFASGATTEPMVRVERMPGWMAAERRLMLDPPVSKHGISAWYQAKAIQMLASTIFSQEPESKSQPARHRRLAQERIERARTLLERDLENPPSLGMLAEEVGCSPFYLSRQFAEETGFSIPKYLRKRRVELAARLLARGEANVTEAAMQVGYSSLSAFNKAFVEEMGCCPGLYPREGSPRGAAAGTRG